MGQHFAVDMLALLHRAPDQQQVYHLIETAGNTARRRVQFGKYALIETGVAVPADQLQPVHDVRLDLARLHRFQMMRRDHPLTQLFQPLMALQFGTEFGLAQQQNLQQGMRAQLEIREHPQLFQCLYRQVLAFINHQQAATACTRLVMQKSLDGAQHGGFIARGGRRAALPALQSKGQSHAAHHILAREAAGDDLRRRQPRTVYGGHQMRDQRRFARADLAGDGDKALALRQAIAEVGQRLAVRQALKIKRGVWGQLKRPATETIEIIKHWVSPFRSYSAYSRRPMRPNCRSTIPG